MNQLSIDFEAPPIAQARAVGQVAAERAQKRAERTDPTFSERAKAHILFVLKPGEWSGEALTNSCKAQGIVPHDDRAFGAVFAALVKAGRIQCVGTCLRTKGHGTAGGRMWRLVR